MQEYQSVSPFFLSKSIAVTKPSTIELSSGSPVAPNTWMLNFQFDSCMILCCFILGMFHWWTILKLALNGWYFFIFWPPTNPLKGWIFHVPNWLHLRILIVDDLWGWHHPQRSTHTSCYSPYSISRPHLEVQLLHPQICQSLWKTLEWNGPTFFKKRQENSLPPKFTPQKKPGGNPWAESTDRWKPLWQK